MPVPAFSNLALGAVFSWALPLRYLYVSRCRILIPLRIHHWPVGKQCRNYCCGQDNEDHHHPRDIAKLPQHPSADYGSSIYCQRDLPVFRYFLRHCFGFRCCLRHILLPGLVASRRRSQCPAGRPHRAWRSFSKRRSAPCRSEHRWRRSGACLLRKRTARPAGGKARAKRSRRLPLAWRSPI
jgi:hypothetical protein